MVRDAECAVLAMAESPCHDNSLLDDNSTVIRLGHICLGPKPCTCTNANRVQPSCFSTLVFPLINGYFPSTRSRPDQDD